MNDSTFLDAIVAEPDDLTHRLVFADWLEEQDTPPARARAAFIRAQIERQSLPAYSPRARALLLQERRLYAEFGQGWAAGFHFLTRGLQFQRGFVEHVRVTPEQFIQNGPRMFGLAPIRSVQVRGTIGLPTLLSRDPRHVRTLCDLLGRIRSLDLNRDYLGEAAGLALLELPRLPRLGCLRLAHNALSPAGIGILAGSEVLDSLHTLEFTASATAAEALQALLHSQRLTGLRNLSLAGARLGDRAVRLVVRSPLMGRLRSLCLSHNQITPAGLRALTESPAAAGLESLDVSFNPLGPEGVALLDRSAHLPRLRELNLSRTDLGDAGARALASGTLLGRLEALDLSLNRIGPPGAAALAEYPHPCRLQCLDLIYNPLGGGSATGLSLRFGEDVCLLGR